ncbi:MAG: nuclear transport factor 2 family protein [Ilumatobacteraceae bacterium]
MGLLFQPRRMASETTPAPPPPGSAAELLDRTLVFAAALEAVLLGDASRFNDLFTDDVEFHSPHLGVTSLHAVQSAFGVPEDSLSDVDIVIVALDAIDAKVIAEWRLDATFSQALLFDDNLLIEPTGGRVQLRGASVAEFRDVRIAAFRHYFDDSQLLDDLPGVPDQLRWMSARPR